MLHARHRAFCASRGAGAWGDNSRFGYGLYRPEEKITVKFLKEIGEENTAANRSRVVFGGKLKENQSGSLSGTQKFLQHKKSGLLVDMTAKIRLEKTPETGLNVKTSFLLFKATPNGWNSPEPIYKKASTSL